MLGQLGIVAGWRYGGALDRVLPGLMFLQAIPYFFFALQGFGLALGFVVSGALVMEIVFSYPGIGLLLLNAVSSNDFPLMQAIFLVITFAVLLANLIVDFIIVVADPRARVQEATR